MADILAVDDSATMRALISRALSTQGHSVRLAADGEEALEMIASCEPQMVITDINMPRLDGFGLIEAVRKTYNDFLVPILILSTESDREMKDRARDLGASGWIVKPFDDEGLKNVVQKLLVR